jgi:hypothetical protein
LGPDGNYSVGWLAAFNLDGALHWKRNYDPGVNTEFIDVAVNNEGKVVCAGWADYGYSFLVVGFNPDGSFDWQYPVNATGSSEMWISELVPDDDGNWYAVGSEEVGSFSEFDMVTLKLDGSGQLLWSEHFNNGYGNYGYLIRRAPNGNILSFGSIEDDFDYMVRTIAYDDQGNELWATNYDLDDYSDPVNVELNDAGEIFIAVQDLDSIGVVKLSPTGTVLAEQNYDRSSIDYLTDLSIDGNEVYTCGYSQDGLRSMVLTLADGTLDELATVVSTGIPFSDAAPGALVNDGSSIWVTTFADAGDSATYSVIRMDATGGILWEQSRTILSANPKFEHLVHDGEGNIIGMYENLVNGGVTDLGVVKYDPDGNEVFLIEYDSAVTFVAGAITTDPTNNVYVCGYNQTARVMFLEKYDPSGTLIWRDEYVSPSTSFPYAIAERMVYTGQDKLVLAGIHKNADNDNNLYLFQYDADGNVEWQTEVDVRPGNIVTTSGLYVDAAGNVVVFGSSGTSSYVAAAYDATGASLWSDTNVLAATVAPNSLAVDENGNAYLCFSSSTAARVRKLDASGNELDDEQFALPSSGAHFFPRYCAILGDRLAIVGSHIMDGVQVPFEMVLDDQLGFLSGRVDSSYVAQFAAADVHMNTIRAAFTEGDLFGGQGYRTAMIRQYSMGSVGIAEDASNDRAPFSIRPNPASDFFIITPTALEGSTFRISLLDATGKEVSVLESKVRLHSEQEQTLQFPPNVAPGYYVLQVRSAEATYHARIVKQ